MEGLCYLCGRVLAKGGMSEHVSACLKKSGLTGTQKYFKIAVNGDYFINPPLYWLIVAAKADAMLDDFDAFLRDVWLECHAHLSVFHIGKKAYVSEGFPPELREDCEWMRDYRLDQVLRFDEALHAGTKFSYEYDFGSTTELKLKVLGVDMIRDGEDFMVLARNLPPEIACDVCGSKATAVCSTCNESHCDVAFLCEKHAEKHKCLRCECRPDSLLPVTNSPRVGVCSFTGGNEKFSVEEALRRLRGTKR